MSDDEDDCNEKKDKYTKHHIYPKSRVNGQAIKGNIRYKLGTHHLWFHQVFGNRTIEEVMIFTKLLRNGHVLLKDFQKNAFNNLFNGKSIYAIEEEILKEWTPYEPIEREFFIGCKWCKTLKKKEELVVHNACMICEECKEKIDRLSIIIL